MVVPGAGARPYSRAQAPSGVQWAVSRAGQPGWRRRGGSASGGPPRRVPPEILGISPYHSPIGGPPATHAGESRFLYSIISTVGSSLDLDEVLDAVVRLLTDATSVHACFVYLVEDEDRLVLAAAPEPYAELVGHVVLERGESLAWWAAERKEPAWIREGLLEDPRTKYVPELEEELFQSLVCVPIVGKDGNVIGVISSHTRAPREFTEAEVDVLVSSASLVAGAIENARLYEEMRRRVAELEHLTELGETLARAETLGELLPAVAERGARLLRAKDCHLYLLDPGSEQLRLRASAPRGATAREEIGLAELGPEVARSGRSASVAVPLVAGDELLGLLAATGTSEVGLARAVANQAAVAIKKIELIERLTEKNLIKDFFEQLASGEAIPGLEGRAARLGCDLDRRYLVLAASPPSDELERALAAAAPGSLFDRRDDSVRALLRVPSEGPERLLATVRELQLQLESPASIGLSNVCRGAASFAAGFEEARHALLGTTVLQGTPGVMAYEELGPYKYLLRMPFDGGVRDAHRDAVARIAEYDRQRSTALLRTLEEFLRRRGNISSTAEALYVHPNTLRQRLRRIGELSGLDLRKDDWLMVEIAVKMVRLQEALGTAGPDTTPPERL
jgi:GAF domain-containing protein